VDFAPIGTRKSLFRLDH